MNFTRFAAFGVLFAAANHVSPPLAGNSVLGRSRSVVVRRGLFLRYCDGHLTARRSVQLGHVHGRRVL